ncbi:hypothetical protein A2W54_02830 [Candidatus Giovannonibacteria bacterium RIFCSPHIGHO2_02_43_13]|uniref:Uncharacterized protein n=1 Tax=Candidatus Giovannonibacteria bacterium RIFCSPHIGHO2_02_43_13 TaxID=1798330 RepID=A0A1F5WQ18_9BACT|nr:MAG: hypothetical protein A3E06_04000 [Candidatus Giovannonibacteria bacterium RIFCSPHIGHO2_12_FULL_44_42]OGF77677.1 MAG: hypothetical protein A2W54_02830 [Candidatus Giovannonibacteria bacterium RIFCSPHIGHO2_02_43_13]OGF88977.1 MAG: hypothetical protein A3I94_03660 [Candidatus Giovannonibacteria bacterium RIFCSPLOWO2_02_FULL_43_54]OGF97413.1 MAG: hypothetical protein A3H08_04010 [Candidatus Giovannonibacteria bacterium RIFCSPLOWO2_12_FULL_44_32]
MNKKEKQNRIKELIGNSLIPKEVKQIVLKNLVKYDEKILDGMLESLARESVAMNKLASDLMRFDVESQKRWDDLEIEQLKVADDFVEQAFKDLTG